MPHSLIESRFGKVPATSSLVESRHGKKLAAASLIALGLLVTGCGNEHPTAQATKVRNTTSDNSPTPRVKPNNARLNMALDLCADKLINAKVSNETHMDLFCAKSTDSGQFSRSNTQIKAYSWYDSATSSKVINAVLQYFPANDKVLYDVEKSLGGKDEPLGSTPCVLIRYKDQSVNNYDCFVDEHYYTSVIDGSGFQFPISTYQSISRLVIAEASK